MFKKKESAQTPATEKSKPAKPSRIKTCRECALCDVNLGAQSGKCHYNPKPEPVGLNNWCFHFLET